jgi:O-antigen/teichoic acid export membrane protein
VLTAITVLTLLVDGFGGDTGGATWRLVLTTAFTVLAPGWAVTAYARSVTQSFLWSVGIAVSLGIGMIVGQVMLVVHVWQPRYAILGLAALTLVPLVHHLHRLDLLAGLEQRYQAFLARSAPVSDRRFTNAAADDKTVVDDKTVFIERFPVKDDKAEDETDKRETKKDETDKPATRPDELERIPGGPRIDNAMTRPLGRLFGEPLSRQLGEPLTAQLGEPLTMPLGQLLTGQFWVEQLSGQLLDPPDETALAPTVVLKKVDYSKVPAEPPAVIGAGGVGMVRDGVWLSLGAAFTSVAGLIGWIISARFGSRDVVGETAAFTSGFLLVSSLSQISLGPALLRWLPRAGKRTGALLIRSYLVIVLAALAGAGLFIALPAGRHALAALPGWAAPMFIGTTLAWALLQFQDPVLTSVNKAGTVLAKNLGFGVGRVGILLIAGSTAGALGIVLSWAVPAVIAALAVSVVVVRAAVHRRGQRGGALPDRTEITRLLGPTYLATIGQSLLYYLLPLIVTGRVGAADGAVFFVVWTAVTALDVAGTGFVNSLVVRVSVRPAEVGQLTRMAGSRLIMIFAPMMLLGAGIAYPLLSLFGHDYATVGATALRLVLLGCLPRLVVLLAVGVCQAQGKGFIVAALQLSSAATMIPVAVILPASLTMIGIGFVVVQVAVAIGAAITLRSRLHAKNIEEIVPISAEKQPA